MEGGTRMDKLHELLDELCPNGVRYIALGEVTHYSTERIDATNIDKYTYVGVDNLLPEKKGKTVSDYVPTEGRLVQFEAGDILIGNIRPYLKKIWLADTDGGTNGDVLVIRIEDKRILAPAFLYYVLSADSFFDFNMQNAKGAKMPRGDKAAIMRYEIPIPPLPVQAEIVRILDAFTELTAELVDKLNMEIIERKKQYAYYRDLLLSFDYSSTPQFRGNAQKIRYFLAHTATPIRRKRSGTQDSFGLLTLMKTVA